MIILYICLYYNKVFFASVVNYMYLQTRSKLSIQSHPKKITKYHLYPNSLCDYKPFPLHTALTGSLLTTPPNPLNAVPSFTKVPSLVTMVPSLDLIIKLEGRLPPSPLSAL